MQKSSNSSWKRKTKNESRKTKNANKTNGYCCVYKEGRKKSKKYSILTFFFQTQIRFSPIRCAVHFSFSLIASHKRNNCEKIHFFSSPDVRITNKHTKKKAEKYSYSTKPSQAKTSRFNKTFTKSNSILFIL